MSKANSKASDLYGLQVGFVEVIDPEFGTLKIRQNGDGHASARFVSNEDLSCYGVSRGVASKWGSSILVDGYALVDKHRRIVVHFSPGEDGRPSPDLRLYVEGQQVMIPGRLRDKVPEVQGALVAIHVYPAGRPTDVAETVWVAGSLAQLLFDKPGLTARIVADAPFRPCLLPFIQGYLGFVHKESTHLNSAEKAQHLTALRAICDSTNLAEVHEWARMEIEKLRNDDGDGALGGLRHSGLISVLPCQSFTTATVAQTDNEVESRPTIGVPRTRLELGDGGVEPC